jgi:hypothetical protein
MIAHPHPSAAFGASLLLPMGEGLKGAIISLSHGEREGAREAKPSGKGEGR